MAERLGWHIGDVVRKLRENRRWTQTLLGEKAGGLNKATIVRVEEGGNVKVETIQAVARGFGLSIAELYSLLPEQETAQAPAVAGGTFRGADRRTVNLGQGPQGEQRRAGDPGAHQLASKARG